MTGALDHSARTSAAEQLSPPALPLGLPATAELLALGGDARIALDPMTGRNKYGCAAAPAPGLADFASSTASTISARGFAAAEALRRRLEAAEGRERRAAVYSRELQRVRGELIGLCGLADLPGLDVVFAASGTDIHLLAAALVGGTRDKPLVCINLEAAETGSGVPDALAGRHFSTRTALGEAVAPGLPAGAFGEVVQISAREACGALRAGADIEADLDAVVLEAAEAGRRALLVMTDVSKTGLISPSPEAALALARRFPRTLDVLVDACQFRLAPETLRAYLDQGFMVAVTGSKFVTGPTFCGALFVPEAMSHALKTRLLPADLRAYSARAEWPEAWVAGASMADEANYGLLLRWEAALAELAAFRAVSPAQVESFMRIFARVMRRRLAAERAFEPLPTRRIDRSALGVGGGWDRIASIFPFLLRHPDGAWFTLAETEAVYQRLGGEGVRLGQPVLCGRRDGVPVSALRLCNSARLVTDALLDGGDPASAIAGALLALDRVAAAAADFSAA